MDAFKLKAEKDFNLKPVIAAHEAAGGHEVNLATTVKEYPRSRGIVIKNDYKVVKGDDGQEYVVRIARGKESTKFSAEV